MFDKVLKIYIYIKKIIFLYLILLLKFKKYIKVIYWL